MQHLLNRERKRKEQYLFGVTSNPTIRAEPVSGSLWYMTLKLKWLLIKYFSSLLCRKIVKLLQYGVTKMILQIKLYNKIQAELYPLIVSFEPNTKSMFICCWLTAIPPLSTNSNRKVIQNPACSIQSFKGQWNSKQKPIDKHQRGQWILAN